MSYLISIIRKLNYIAQLKRRQKLSESEIKMEQERRLKKILEHSYNNVEYYHDLFKSVKLKPSDIKTINDLIKIPITTKKEILENYPNRIIASGTNLNSCHVRNTSGSTGLPLKCCFNHKENDYLHASSMYFFSESGARWSDKIVTIKHNKSIDSWRNKFGIAIRNNISIFDTNENICKKLIEIKPDVLLTYPSMLSLLAKTIKEKKITSINPRLILTTGETLTDDLRERLCEIFNAEIFRYYASEEFGVFAFECKEHSGYHILTDNVVIELINNGNIIRTGEKGEVIVTGLYNYTMPLIRYRLGDIAISNKDKCSCQRSLPLVKELVGREDDYLILPSGKKISPRMINVIESIQGIAAYKTIQETPDRFVVKLIKNNDYSKNTDEEVKNQIRLGCLGEKVDVIVELVNALPKERYGKIRTVISYVNN